MSVRIVLPPESASVPQARRFVADQLGDLSPDTVDVARLLVSEIVTNAVLHAGTELVLTLERGESTVQVQIEDGNPLLPVVRSHGPDAGTGRGLHVLDRMASRWGTSEVDGGKIVWFEIPTTVLPTPRDTRKTPLGSQGAALGAARESNGLEGGGLEGGGRDGGGLEASRPIDRSDATTHSGVLRDPRPNRTRDEHSESDHLVKFQWLGLPLAHLDQTAEHYDAVLREFHLMLEREPKARAAVPGRLIAIMDELTHFLPLIASVEQDLEQARRAGISSIDVGFDLPTEIGALALRLDNLLDETDAYCAAGVELLSLEPNTEVVAMRKWLIGELARQAEGHPAVAWHDSPWARRCPGTAGAASSQALADTMSVRASAPVERMAETE